ncbi:MAG: serine/threonine-protein kinase [Acidobacteriota bacterium]|nr:serine/threonine-protein kinase [Acidobacteriota bacterium]
MTPDDSQSLEGLFVSLLDLDPRGQTAFLAQIKQEDPCLAARLETMLRGFKDFDRDVLERMEPSALNRLVSDSALTTVADCPKGAGDDLIPRQIGNYSILRLIGEGGMGRVFLAEQDVPKRKVALKLISPKIGTTSVLQRFRSEYQAQAQMKHEHIARLIEAGTTEQGETFFTMEYLEGTPLVTFCRENALSPRQRLLLFRQVCRGVQHAHQRTILHRDLKPSNILVVAGKDGPRAKIIDFGLAKDLSGGEDFLELTQQGQLIGTPLYMCPEQLKGQAMDIRGDIYSLGVILYELLAQRHPLDKQRLKALSLQEVLRICTLEEPPAPSVRVAEAAAAKAVSKKELRFIRGDLDWITMKAMAKDIDRRYPSLAEFIDDLDRFLDNRPVSARPPSRSYRVSKFLKRNKLLVAACSLALSALILGFTIATISAVRLKHAKQETEAALARFRVSQGFMVETFASPDPRNTGPRALVVDLLESADGRLQALRQDPELIGTLRTTLGRTYLGLGIDPKAEQQLRNALAARRALLGEQHPDTSRTRYYLALSLMRADKLQEARQVVEACIDYQRRDPGARHPDSLRSQALLAMILTMQKDFEVAQTLFDDVLGIQQEVLGRDHPETLQSLVGLGNVLFKQRDYSGAKHYYRQALSFQEVRPGPRSPDTLATRYQLGQTLHRLRRCTEAEALIAETVALRSSVLGPAHPRTLNTRYLWATCLYHQEKFARAEVILLSLLEDGRRLSDDPAAEQLLLAQNRLAMVYHKTQRTDQAILLLKELDKIAAENRRRNSRQHLKALHNLGDMLRKNDGTLGEAERYYERALDGRIQCLGSEHPKTLKTWFDLAEVYGRLGRDEMGFFISRPWLVAKTAPSRNRHRALFGLAYAEWLMRANRPGEAQDILRELYREACAKDTPLLPRIEEAVSQAVDQAKPSDHKQLRKESKNFQIF